MRALPVLLAAIALAGIAAAHPPTVLDLARAKIGDANALGTLTLRAPDGHERATTVRAADFLATLARAGLDRAPRVAPQDGHTIGADAGGVDPSFGIACGTLSVANVFDDAPAFSKIRSTTRAPTDVGVDPVCSGFLGVEHTYTNVDFDMASDLGSCALAPVTLPAGGLVCASSGALAFEGTAAVGDFTTPLIHIDFILGETGEWDFNPGS
jgi:hypothetical protein